MGKVYSTPKEIGDKPQIGGRNFDFTKYGKECEEYVGKIVAYAKKNGKGPYAGEEIRFGVADGYARYIVFSTSPVALIHIDTMDGYQYPYVHRLTTADIKKEVQGRAILDKLFSSKS